MEVRYAISELKIVLWTNGQKGNLHNEEKWTVVGKNCM
jgi:hypothetical protein